MEASWRCWNIEGGCVVLYLVRVLGRSCVEGQGAAPALRPGARTLQAALAQKADPPCWEICPCILMTHGEQRQRNGHSLNKLLSVTPESLRSNLSHQIPTEAPCTFSHSHSASPQPSHRDGRAISFHALAGLTQNICGLFWSSPSPGCMQGLVLIW